MTCLHLPILPHLPNICILHQTFLFRLTNCGAVVGAGAGGDDDGDGFDNNCGVKKRRW